MTSSLHRSKASVTPGRRDPEGRRRAIIIAAAELVVENGASALTHRAVAARAQVALGSTTQYFSSIDELRDSALELLAFEIDQELEYIEKLFTDFSDSPEQAASALHEFLIDPRQVRADIALMTAATSDASNRALALRWFDRLVELIATHIGEERAKAIAIYFDGATIHAGLHETPVSTAEISRVIHALATMPVPDRPSTTA